MAYDALLLLLLLGLLLRRQLQQRGQLAPADRAGVRRQRARRELVGAVGVAHLVCEPVLAHLYNTPTANRQTKAL